MRFLHISDLHLGKIFPVSRYGQQFAHRRRQELLDTFSRLIDFANQNQVDFILCCGDFLNSEELRVEELRNINAMIERLEHAVIVAISGNHDPQTKNSAYQKIDWSKRFYLAAPGSGRVALSAYRTIITYHSWDQKEMPEPIEVPKPSTQSGQYQILMLHADALTKSRYLPLDAQKLSEAGFDYVALGHIHKMQCVAPNVYYSGSPEPLDFGESGEHGFMMVDVEGERRRVQFVPFSQREYRQLSVQVGENDSEMSISDRIASSIIREDPHHIYTVTLVGNYPLGARWNIEKIEDDLRYKEYFCSIEDKTRPQYDIDALYRENQGNLIGNFIGSFLRRESGAENGEKLDAERELEEKALYYGLEVLLSQREPQSNPGLDNKQKREEG